MTKQEIKDLFEKLFAEIPDDETTETETTETETETTSTDVETVENPVETLETETRTETTTKSGDEVTTNTTIEHTIKVNEDGDYIYV